MIVKGTGLQQRNKVTSGGVKATTFTVNSATQATATVPTGANNGKDRHCQTGGVATSPEHLQNRLRAHAGHRDSSVASTSAPKNAHPKRRRSWSIR